MPVRARGSLTVVGTGIQVGSHFTPEGRHAFEQAEVALYLVADPVAEGWLRTLNAGARSLGSHYRVGRDRREIYESMAEEILAAVRGGAAVCAAFYGHPCVFVYPSRAAVERARAEGFDARMLPAVSAEDCLFADLGVDPGAAGCQSYEATDLLLSRRPIDPTAALVVWQVAAIGEKSYPDELRHDRMPVLVDYLREFYDPDHRVTLYEASPYPLADASVVELRLGDLDRAEPSALATLYVPPLEPRPRDPEMLRRLGLES